MSLRGYYFYGVGVEKINTAAWFIILDTVVNYFITTVFIILL